MTKKIKYIIFCPLLIIFWLTPLFDDNLSTDTAFIKTAVSYFLFFVAAVLCRLLPNRHAALISAALVGAGSCVLQPVAMYDCIPVLLLCCWLRCWLERENGNAVWIYFEAVTDLVYVSLVAAVIRLLRFGFSFVEIRQTNIQAVPDFCLMVFIDLLFLVLFVAGAGKKARPTGVGKGKTKGTHRAERRIVGVIPVYISLRTFWGFCVLLLSVCLLQYANSKMVSETFLFLRTGFRLLFLPWMSLLFLVADAFLPGTAFWKRLTRE